MSAAPAAPRELARAWNAVLGRLELEVSRPSFETWLRGTRALRLDGGAVVVEAARLSGVDWLNEQLGTVVTRAAADVFGAAVEVRFVARQAAPAAALQAAMTAQVATPPPPEPSPPVLGNLNRCFTFDRYIASDGNQLALRNCSALVDGQGLRITPHVLYGAPGMGKTHLLHAVAGCAAAAGWPIACLGAEEFTSRYLRALRGGSIEQFQAAVRGVSLFALDDLQYVAGKKGTQDEIVNTIEAVTNAGGYVVVASEQNPLHLDLLDRLISRLASGLVTRIGPLDWEERRTFARRHAAGMRCALPEWAVERVAGIEAPSVRVLQGAVNAAVALAAAGRLDLAALDAELVRICLAEATPSGVLRERELLDLVARRYEVTLDEVAGRSRRGPVAAARAVAVAALQREGRSLAEIANLLGGRHRSTIHELGEKGQALLDEDPVLRERCRRRQLAG